MLCKRGLYVVRNNYVSVKTNKHIFNFFHRRAPCPHHSSFPTPNGMAIFRRASNAGVVGRNRDSESITVNAATGQVL